MNRTAHLAAVTAAFPFMLVWSHLGLRLPPVHRHRHQGAPVVLVSPPTSTTTTTAPAPPSPPPPPAWGTYAADAVTTTTPDWACIRQWESGDNYTDYAGAYGFEGGYYGSTSPATQNAMALRIFAANGYHFSGAWNDPCTAQMGLW